LSIRCADTARTDGAAWLGDAVVVLPNGDRMSGRYDGYGSVGGFEVVDHDGAMAMWHGECFVKAGRPGYSKPSPSASDQGYFADHWPKSLMEADFIAPELRDVSPLAGLWDKDKPAP